MVFFYIMYDVNLGGNIQRYGALADYLEFNGSWGTNRGYVWQATWKAFGDLPFIKKLVGYGPDTFRMFALDFFYDELAAATGQRFDNAHNEYLQYLVTIGWLGLLSYLLFLVSMGLQMVRGMVRNPCAAGLFVAVLCYLAQAVVNINLPIVTPMVWLLLSCGGAVYRCHIKSDVSAIK